MAPSATAEDSKPLLPPDDSPLSADLLDEPEELFIEYPARWWTLFHFSLFCALQGWAWAIPGTISTTYETLYGLDDATIAWLLNYGALGFLIVCFPLGVWMDRPGGIRGNLFFGAALVLGGCVLRLLATDEGPRSVALLHVSYVLTALAGPIAMSAVSKFSEEWFSPASRATATATAQMSNGLGTALASLVGPQMVMSGTWASLQRYNWVMAGIVGFNAFCMLAYFPAHPPTPPSRSAIASRSQGAGMTLGKLMGVIRALSRNVDFLVLCAAYGIGGGMQAGWSGLLVINLSSIGVDQVTAGWMNFSASAVGNLVSILMGRCADRTRAFKRIIVIGAAVNALATVFITLGLEGLLPPSVQGLSTLVPALYVAFILGYGSVSSFPIMFELVREGQGEECGGLGVGWGGGVTSAVLFLPCSYNDLSYPMAPPQAIEATHPLPEATVITVMTAVYNAGAAAMLFVPVQSSSVSFNWIYMAGQLSITLLLTFGLRERFVRYGVDTGVALKEPGGPEEGGSVKR